jgi:hypothetical protein
MTKYILIALPLLMAASANAAYDNVKVFSGSSWIEDTWIDSTNRETNYGGADTISLYNFGATQNRGLMRPIGTWRDSIPAGATVKRAWWRVWVTYKSATATPNTNRLCPNWVEGEATWVEAADGTNWATAGAAASGTACADCAGSGSVDYEGTAASTIIGAISRWEDIPIDTCHINDWIENRDSVNGTIITLGSSPQVLTFTSTEGDSVPKFVIEFDTDDMVSVGRNDGNEATDTYIRGGGDSANHYNTGTTMLISNYEPTTSYITVLVRWLDALGSQINGRTVDSAFLFLRPTIVESGGDTVLTIMRATRLWTAAEVDYYQYASASDWTTAAAKGNGTDRVTTDSVSTQIIGGKPGTDVRFDVSTQVQAWAADTSLNRGWQLYGGSSSGGATNYIAFAAADNTWKGYRPLVRIYMAPEATGPPDYRHGPDGTGQRHGPDGASVRHRP